MWGKSSYGFSKMLAIHTIKKSIVLQIIWKTNSIGAKNKTTNKDIHIFGFVAVVVQCASSISPSSCSTVIQWVVNSTYSTLNKEIEHLRIEERNSTITKRPYSKIVSQRFQTGKKKFFLDSIGETVSKMCINCEKKNRQNNPRFKNILIFGILYSYYFI